MANSGPADALFAVLRRGLPLLLAGALVGGMGGGISSWLQPVEHLASAEIVAVRASEPERPRGAPISIADLKSHFSSEVQARAERELSLPPGALTERVEVTPRAERGVYAVEVVYEAPAVAQRAAQTLAKLVVERWNGLREREADGAAAHLELAQATLARETAERAYLEELSTGRLEGAEVLFSRERTKERATLLADARLTRERLRLAFERARDAERGELDARLHARTVAYAIEPRLELVEEVRAAVPRANRPARDAAAGAGLGFFLVLMGIVLPGGRRLEEGP